MLISIIIPCYNCEKFINECIHSCLTQTYKNLEIICIDNNSTDNTFGILKKIKNANHQIQIFHENKPGASAARNKGLAFAKGKWIQFLDADDIILPYKIESDVNSLECDASFMVGNYFSQSQNIKKSIVVDSSLSNWVLLSSGMLGKTSANLFNRKYLFYIGGWNEQLKSSQEYDLMFRLLKNNYKVVFNEEINTIINRTEGSISTNKNAQYHNILRRISLRKSILEYCLGLTLTEEEIFRIRQCLFNSIRELFFIKKRKQSLALYIKNLGKDFIPQNDIVNTRLYIHSHEIIGFYFANYISIWIKLFRKTRLEIQNRILKF